MRRVADDPEGIGIGIMPELIAASYLTRYSLTTIRLPDYWARRRLHVCAQPREELRVPVAEFLDHVLTS
jgi:DNA-binding transcriptional LysR family regulator